MYFTRVYTLEDKTGNLIFFVILLFFEYPFNFHILKNIKIKFIYKKL